MEVKGTQQPTESAALAAISVVLGNDDLLREILLRLDYPTCLVRAATVCKLWFRRASDPAFLRRFRALHPPRLLGFFSVFGDAPGSSLFVPIPQPPELAGVVRRILDTFPDGSSDVRDCRNGRVLVKLDDDKYAVRSPLCPARDTAVLPPMPTFSDDDRRQSCCGHFALFPKDGLSCCHSWLQAGGVHEMFARVSVSQAGSWVSHTMAATEFLDFTVYPRSLLVEGNLYMVAIFGYIIGFDLAARSFFVVDLPDGMTFRGPIHLTIRLSWAEDSGLYLVHARDFELHIWLSKTDGAGCRVGAWELVDTVSLHWLLGHPTEPFCDSWFAQPNFVSIHAVGDNAEFALLTVLGNNGVFYLDTKNRTVEKVYEVSPGLWQIGTHPFMMAWPPVFPALKEWHDQEG